METRVNVQLGNWISMLFQGEGYLESFTQEQRGVRGTSLAVELIDLKTEA